MNAPRFLVGIDLGTAHCAVASVDLARGEALQVEDALIPQVVGLGQVAPRPLLPSCLYLADSGEFPEGAIALPWDPQPGEIVGEFARSHGARVPGRLVVSAKSWLCHGAVDRTADILPWGAGGGLPKVSPVEASARLLRHLVQAWDREHPEHPMAAQDGVITVPASFDAVARALTVEAARLAGLEGFSLVEEPQAAFEAFAWEHRERLAQELEGVRLILVVDIGGGTTDFTLVESAPGADGPALRRIAVGEHLMLGGDNMDAALARRAEERMVSGGRRLGAVQWSQLLQACREAKEALLAEDASGDCRIAVAGSGSALMGGTFSARLTQAEATELVMEGFFPRCGVDDRPRRTARAGLQEWGLPYAQDPSIPRQLLGFLAAHREAGWKVLGKGVERVFPDGSLPRPDAILLNGGVLKSRRLADRLLEVVSGWWPEAPPIRLLGSQSLDLAVARGAVCHALARRGLGRRVAGGASHAVYVGVEVGEGKRRSALCVVPRGMEEGTTADLGAREFRLTTGRPVQFPLYTSTSDVADSAGDLVEVREDWQVLPPLQTVLKSEREGPSRMVPVQLRSTLTPLGTLEMWCVSPGGEDRWKLEFELRGTTTRHSPNPPDPLPARFSDARGLLERAFPARNKPQGEDPVAAAKGARQLLTGLERLLGERSEWSVSLLRELWAAAWAGAARRRRSADHERVFFQITGFALRPGFGVPGDAWRCEEMAGRFGEGVQWGKDRAVWVEYWVCWRRIAGGLSPARHEEIWGFLRPHLAWALDLEYPRHVGRPKGVQPEGLHEMVRLAAALEHLPTGTKEVLGGWIGAQLRDPSSPGGPWAWALGRLGARAPLYGSPHQVVSPEVAGQWLIWLTDAQRRGVDGAAFAMAQIARMTGDRSRDLGEDVRENVVAALRQSGCPASWETLVREVAVLDRADEARVLGDALPAGLSL